MIFKTCFGLKRKSNTDEHSKVEKITKIYDCRCRIKEGIDRNDLRACPNKKIDEKLQDYLFLSQYVRLDFNN